MRLDVTLMHRAGPEFALYYDIRVFESLLDVSHFEEKMVRNVSALGPVSLVA